VLVSVALASGVWIWQAAHRISRRTGQLSNRCAKMPACD
jgi:hypothetical protein